MNAQMAKTLREAFKPEQIGHVPKAGITLDYVGHAATTDRLLQADPAWTWEPMGRDSFGNPEVVRDPDFFSDRTAKVGIWISLLVGDTATPGFGEGKNAKEAIGDAIRNAAMRRGVALDLWSKEDLSSSDAIPPAPAPPEDRPAPKPNEHPLFKEQEDLIVALAKQINADVELAPIRAKFDEKRSQPAYASWLEQQVRKMRASVEAKAADKAADAEEKAAREASPFQTPAGVAA